MTPADKLSELLAAATPGPWTVRVNKRDGEECFDRSICGDIFVLADLTGPAYAHQLPNAALIAMAPELAAEVLQLRAENAELIEANALLVVRLEKARGMGQQLVDDGECGYEITQRWHTWLTGKDE